jgi:predicted CoA-binding protein
MDDAKIRALLERSKVVAVVGLSDRPERDSHGVARYLQRAGYRVIPVNPQATEILGEKAYADLRDVPDKIDVVDIFRRPEFVPDIVDAAIAVGAQAVWMQLGVVHEEAAARARAAGLEVVMDRCIAVEHRLRYASKK